MRRYGNVIGALSGLLLPASVIVLIAARAREMSQDVFVWPLLAALATSVVGWWLQGLIYALLAQPVLKRLRVGDMFRVEMSGLFVACVSPIRGAELPYKAYLLKRLGLSAGEGSNVVVTRVVLDAVVLTPSGLAALAFYSTALPKLQNPELLFAGLAAIGASITVALLVWRRAGRASESETMRTSPSGRPAASKLSGFLRDVQRSFASYWRPGHRTALVYATALAVVYWGFRISAGLLALMAAGWSGDWLPVVVAQLLLISLVLPFAPTPGGSGAREAGLAALLSGHAPEGQLLSGLVMHTAVSHWLPLTAGAFFAVHGLWRGVFHRSVTSCQTVEK